MLFWDLLRNPLMRSCLVEVGHIRIEHTLELPLMQEQQVVEAFLPHTPHEAFADGVGALQCQAPRQEIISHSFTVLSLLVGVISFVLIC